MNFVSNAPSSVPNLSTIIKSYTTGRGDSKRTITCAKAIPISTTMVEDMKINLSVVDPIVDEEGKLVSLEFKGIDIHFTDDLIFSVPTFATILKNKQKVIKKNSTSNIVSKGQICSGFYMRIVDEDFWIPCLWSTVKSKETCSIIKDTDLGRLGPFGFCCEGLRSKITQNPLVKYT